MKKLLLISILFVLCGAVFSSPAHAQATPYPNQCIGDTTTGTTINTLTKLTTAGNCIVMATTDVNPGAFVGIITAGAGKGGTQQLCFTGICPLAVDGTATAGDCVIESVTSGGSGHDTGATVCNENAIGRVVNVGNAGAGSGTAFVFVFTTVPGVGVSDYSPKAYVAGAGTAQAQTATYSPAVPALVAGLAVCWLPTAANTTSGPTLAVNGLTAKSITKLGTSALVANDITTTAIACAIYDGTQFQLQNPQTSVSGVCVPSSFTAQTDGATVTWAIGSLPCVNASLTFTVHSGSRALNITGPVNGGSYVLWIKQDGTGGEGLTLGTGCTWKVNGGGAGAITPSVAANAIDVLAFTYDGTNCYANFAKNFN